jgi:uncharacterized membrane protein HdeD (DUF308 family)
MEENTQVEQLAGEVRANWGWLLFVGIALVVLGTIGLYMVGTLTLVSILYFGVLVIAGGVLTLIDAFKAEGWKAKLWEILIGVLYIVAGLIMILYPGASAVWFTAFIAAFLLVSGIFRIIMGFQVRSEVKGWGWIVFGGAASIVLALVIYAQWPVSGLWVIGLFIAIEMIMQGISMISIAMAARASRDVHAASGA